MNNFWRHTLLILLIVNPLSETILTAHGFYGKTYLKTKSSWQTIEALINTSRTKRKKILSYDLNKHKYIHQNIKSKGFSTSNCYIKIGFDDSPNNDISCTPTQEFYLEKSKKWSPAFLLKEGDMLATFNNTPKQIKSITLIKKPIKVYSIEINKTHTFFVSKHLILTHNMVLPALCAGISIPFGAGGAAGCFLGPIGFFGGIAIGSLIGITLQKRINNQPVPYKLVFNIQRLDQFFLQKEDAKAPAKTVDDVINETKPKNKTKGGSTIRTKKGTFEDALNDFNQLKPTNIKKTKKGKVGHLPDGRTVNVRNDSTAKRPTLEIFNPKNKKKIKIRYNE